MREPQEVERARSWETLSPSCPGQLVGGQKRFSDLAITTTLTLRLVFRLPLRQAEGFLRSVLIFNGLMDVDLEAPDHTTLSRRSRRLDVELHRVPVNHPGIAAIYGLEESNDTRALVLELVEGSTLAARIAEGPIPLQIDDIRRVWWLSPCRQSKPDD